MWLNPGVPNLWAMDQYQSWPVGNRATQQEVRLNVMHLNHPETIPLPPLRSVEKLFSTELVLGAQKVGDRWHNLSRTVHFPL